MANFTFQEANAWLESTRLALSSDDDIEEPLAQSVAAIVLGRLAQAFPNSVAGWANNASTPKLVRTVIAMYYVAAIYDRSYADAIPNDTDNYAALLRNLADSNIAGLIAGTITLPEDSGNATADEPVFFPNDQSSANLPSYDFPSDGGPAFTMGTVF